MDTNKLIRLLLLSVSVMIYLYIFKPKAEVHSNTASLSDQHMPLSSPGIDTPFSAALVGEAQMVTVENAYFKVMLSTKGGMIKKVMLKKHKGPDGKPLVLLDEQSNHMGLLIPYKGLMVETQSLHFQTSASSVYSLSTEQQATIAFRLAIAPMQYIEQIFEFSGNSYEINYSWRAVGMEALLNKENEISFDWKMDVKRLESDEKDLAKSVVNYYLANETFYDLQPNQSEIKTKQLREPIKWVNIKQCSFSSAIIADDTFTHGNFQIAPAPVTLKNIAKKVNLSLALSNQEGVKYCGGFKFFFGPNDYKILKKVSKGFDRNVYLGWKVVRWVNVGLVMPIFNFLENYFTNYGLIILLLVVIIKLLLLPLSYKSYMAMATMKIIKPALDKIKQQYGNDLQKVQTEQVLLYKTLGINPLSGCMPLLLQMPILLAMFNFFPNMIAFRQVPFLWAKDLSTYDSVIQLPFTIPVYGNHVSLFTILLVLSTILYSKSTSAGSVVEGPMKGLSYIMPVTFMFVLNSSPAGLSFYYFVSNVLTFLQQKFISYLVDEENIKEKLQQQLMKQREKAPFQARVASALQSSHKKKK